MKVLVFKTTLRIYYILFFKYLVAEDIIRSAIEYFRTGLRAKSGVESLFNLFISLLIRDDVWDLRVMENAMEA